MLTFLLASLAPSRARAQAGESFDDVPEPPTAFERTSLVLETRAAFGLGDRAGLVLLVPAAGAELRIAPTLAVRGSLLAVAPIGELDVGEAHAGAGGELSLRIVPVPTWVARPYVYFGMGLVLFDAPFLPGGAHYEGILSYGLGLDVSIGDRVTLSANAHYVHLSNGQGLGPHNPAFDGLGAGLSAAYAFADRARSMPTPAPRDPRDGARERFVPGATLDAAIGSVDGSLLASGRLRVAERLTDHSLALAEIESGSLADAAFVELALTAAAHFRAASFGVRAGYRWYATLHQALVAAQLEAHITREVSLLALGVYEGDAGFGDTFRAALGFRAFPLDTLAVDVGVGFAGLGDGAVRDVSDPYWGLEWQLPIPVPELQLSLFLERQVSTISLAGVRGSFGMGATLRDAARHTGFRQLR